MRAWIGLWLKKKNKNQRLSKYIDTPPGGLCSTGGRERERGQGRRVREIEKEEKVEEKYEEDREEEKE